MIIRGYISALLNMDFMLFEAVITGQDYGRVWQLRNC